MAGMPPSEGDGEPLAADPEQHVPVSGAVPWWLSLPLNGGTSSVVLAGAVSLLSNEPSDSLSYVGLLTRRKCAGCANGDISFGITMRLFIL